MTERAEPVRTRPRQAYPRRTCIGCRAPAAKSDLLRVVMDRDGTSVVPDPRGRAPGRGAHLHPTPGCLSLALRRRAFGRALRLAGPYDATPVQEWVDRQAAVRCEGRTTR